MFGGGVEAALGQLLDVARCAARDALDRLDVIREATRGQARTLAFQFGTPPLPGQASLAPRSMLALPWVVERQVVEQSVLDVYATHGRYAFAGYVANVGDGPLRLAWLDVGGAPSGELTLPPSATVQVPCVIRGVIVSPVENESGAVVQVSLS